MRNSRYSGERIIGILRDLEKDVMMTHYGSHHEDSRQVTYHRMQKYGGMETSELRWHPALRSELESS
jgi:hypothetical protein